MVIALAKRAYFANVIVSARSRQTGLFSEVQGFLQSVPMMVEGEYSVVRCDAFTNYFAGKIDHVHSELNAGLTIQNLEMQERRPCPVLWDRFQFIQSEDVGRILQSMRPTTCSLNRCPSWLLKSASAGLGDWLQSIVSASVTSAVMPGI